ncbi:MAG: hypothetical protein ACYTFW_14860 [Planctomycetota bacterium]
MESRNKHTTRVFLSILWIALVFQLCMAPTAWGADYDGGITYDVTEDEWFAFIDGEGTVVNLNATILYGIYMCYNSPGATLNFGADARAGLIDAGSDSFVNIYGGSVDFLVSVSLGAQVTIYGEKFVVADRINGTYQYDPGTTLSIENAVLTAYDAWGTELFTGRISCVSGASVLLDTETKDLDLEVQIDIKPDSNPNIINLCSNGVVPVAILSDETFDATKVLPETVYFAGASVAMHGKDKYMAHEKDVDEDGYDDMLLHFRTNELKLEDGTTTVTLTGQLNSQLTAQSAGQIKDGAMISGTDNVYILRSKK